MSLRGLLIAAPRSGGGKTTVTLGLMRAFRKRGLSVAGLKSGPDYIDPAFHRAALGRDSFNVDSWAMAPGLVGALAGLAAQGAGLVLAEGSMGLFDGVPAPLGRSGASADIAAALGLPVLLVLDASGQAQTAGAVAKGCAVFDPRVKIGGVVLNKIGSPRHLLLAKSGVEAAGLTVVGALPKQADIILPERHLGLVQASETAELEARLDALAAFAESHLDLDAILSLAAPVNLPSGAPRALTPPGQRIAIARDDACSFLYPHLLADWRARGAEFSFFSPLADEPPPPQCDAAWLPGGYPELHAGRLAGNARFLAALRQFAQTRPVHGECGGYMVLGESLTDAGGEVHTMAGLLSVQTSFAKRKMTLGYRDAILLADCALGRKGQKWRGHEFHYASIVALGADEPMAMAADAYGGAPAACGSRRGRVSGSFFHALAEVS
jgi:cobyrinic acid a,c-diamide synthase